jgi:hypothetical protein
MKKYPVYIIIFAIHFTIFYKSQFVYVIGYIFLTKLANIVWPANIDYQSAYLVEGMETCLCVSKVCNNKRLPSHNYVVHFLPSDMYEMIHEQWTYCRR